MSGPGRWGSWQRQIQHIANMGYIDIIFHPLSFMIIMMILLISSLLLSMIILFISLLLLMMLLSMILPLLMIPITTRRLESNPSPCIFPFPQALMVLF